MAAAAAPGLCGLGGVVVLHGLVSLVYKAVDGVFTVSAAAEAEPEQKLAVLGAVGKAHIAVVALVNPL